MFPLKNLNEVSHMGKGCPRSERVSSLEWLTVRTIMAGIPQPFTFPPAQSAANPTRREIL